MERYYSWHEIELAILARDRGRSYDEGAIESAKRRIGRDITRDADGGLFAVREARRSEDH